MLSVANVENVGVSQRLGFPMLSYRMPTRLTHTRAFTLLELIIAIAILGLILASVIPFIMSRREMARRLECAEHLQRIRNAMNAYANDNGGYYPRVRSEEPKAFTGWRAFTGVDDANPFAANSAVETNDVTAALWLLVRGGYVTDTSAFVCPSSSDWQDRLYDAKGTIVPANRRGNFRMPSNLSYSVFCPYSAAAEFKWADTLKAGCPIMADKNPGVGESSDVTRPAAGAAPEAFAAANSLNHGRAGQNVLYADSSVQFESDPYVGDGYVRPSTDPKTGEYHPVQRGDNLYTALRDRPLAPGENATANVNGVFSQSAGPAWQNDSFLVPAAN